MNIGRFDTNNITKHTTVALWITFVITTGLGVWGFVCPPKGVIDDSVLKFSTLLFGIAALAVVREAIKEGLGMRFTHGNTIIEVENGENKTEK